METNRVYPKYLVCLLKFLLGVPVEGCEKVAQGVHLFVLFFKIVSVCSNCRVWTEWQSLPDMAPTNCHFLTEQFRTNLVTDCNFQV